LERHGPRTIRVMSYNVHRCVGTDRVLSPERIAKVIQACNPDIVSLQELDVRRARTGGVDQAAEIARMLGMEMHFHPAYQVQDEHFGDAIFTALPNRLVRRGGLPAPIRRRELERRGALWVEVETPAASLQVVNTHLGLLAIERSIQVDALLGHEWLGDPLCHKPVLLMGDFNAVPRSRAYRRLVRHLKDANAGRKHGATFPSRFPFLRLDHIFMSGNITVHSIAPVRNGATAVASDHLPLVADIEIHPGVDRRSAIG